MDESAVKSLIGTRWVHSHEEDKGDEMVFRTAEFPFPPSRGRQSFELHDNGEMTTFVPGPTDRRESAAGRWSLAGDDLTLASGPAKAQVLKVKAVSPGRLVVDRDQ